MAVETTTGKVLLNDLPGSIQIIIKGDNPSMPWVASFDPQDAYNVGNALVRKALERGAVEEFPAKTSSGAQPSRRPPNPKRARGPQSSVDGVPSSGPTPPPKTEPTLLGEDFE